MTNLRALERMAQIVYGEDAWIAPYQDETMDVYDADRLHPVLRYATIEQAVAHLIDANQRQQAAFNEALRELGESKCYND